MRISFGSCAALALALAALVASAAHAAPPVEAYGRLPAMEDGTLSPSSGRYAYVTVDGDTRKLVVANLGDDHALFASDVGKAKVIGIAWAGDDHLLVTVSHTVDLGPDFQVMKQELTSVIAINLRAGTAFSVFRDKVQVANAVFGFAGSAQVNGRWYGYFGGITYVKGLNGYALDHSWPDLYQVDLDTGVITLAARGGTNSQNWLVGPDGAVIARTLYDEKTGAWDVSAGIVGGKVLGAGRSDFEGVSLIARGRKADSVLIRRPGDKEVVYEQAPLSGAPSEVIADGDKIAGVIEAADTELWIGSVIEGDSPVETFFDPALDARMRLVRQTFPGRSVRLDAFGTTFDRVIVFTTGSGDSGTYWLVDITGHRANPLGYAYPDVQPADVGPIRMVTWKAADGLDLQGVLSLPPGRDPKNLPVVVMPHGGPEARDYPVFDWWAQLFASRGYVVFQPNFRGSSGYGQAFRDAGLGQWGRKMQTDISDGLAELARQGVVDPKRACIAGWSYGGYAALAGVTVQNGLYRCAVSMAGVANLPAMISYAGDESGSQSSATRYWKAFMGATSTFEGELRPLSPAKIADRADAPILLIHGKDDTVVPFEQSVGMADALKRAGKPVEFVTLPGADHWLLREDTRLAMARASVAFVVKYNPPDPAPTSSASATPSP